MSCGEGCRNRYRNTSTQMSWRQGTESRKAEGHAQDDVEEKTRGEKMAKIITKY